MTEARPIGKGKIYGDVEFLGEPGDLTLGENAEIYGPVKIGKNVVIGENARLYGPLKIGNNVIIGPSSKIGYPTLGLLKEMFRKHGKIVAGGLETVIGDNVYIEDNVRIYEDVILRGNNHIFHHADLRQKLDLGDSSWIGCNTIIDPEVKIGKQSFVHANCYLCSRTTIGDFVFMAPMVGTVNEKTAQSRIGMPSEKDGSYHDIEFGPTIGNRCSIGQGAHIMTRVKIGDGAIIGTAAMVTKDVPENQVWAGNPARYLKMREF